MHVQTTTPRFGRRQFIAKLTVFSLVLGSAQPLGAKAPPAPHQSQASAVSNALVAIALNSADTHSNLNEACRRTNFKLLASALAAIRGRISQPKGEFEADAEYADRTAKIEHALNTPDPVIVCQPLDDNEDASFEYDADHEVFKGTFASRQNVWRDEKRLGSYVSHTKMGVRARVSSSVELDYDVDMGAALRPIAGVCATDETLNYSYHAHVPRAEAPVVKSRGYLVFLGRIVAPFVTSEDSAGSPTLDNPNDVYERDLTVHFAPSRMAVVGPDGNQYWGCSLVPSVGGKAESSMGALPDLPPGKIWLQLASAQSADGLPEEFRRIRWEDRELLGDLHPFVVQQSSGFQLIIGPFASATDAQTFATDLRATGVQATEWSNSANDKIAPLAAF